MSEYFKQIFDAWGDRIRSPILGSVLIFFIVINWQVLFYLFFADKPVRARLLYFEANTDHWSLYWLPLFCGLFLAIAVPWVTLLGASLAKLPRSLLHEAQSSEALKRRIFEHRMKADEEEAKVALKEKKVALEDVEGALDEARERRKIEAAKRLAEAKEVSGELETEIEKAREDASEFEWLSSVHWKVLEFASEANDGIFSVDDDKMYSSSKNGDVEIELGRNHKEKKLGEKAIDSLAGKGLLNKKVTKSFNDTHIEYEITLKGYQALEERDF